MFQFYQLSTYHYGSESKPLGVSVMWPNIMAMSPNLSLLNCQTYNFPKKLTIFWLGGRICTQRFPTAPVNSILFQVPWYGLTLFYNMSTNIQKSKQPDVCNKISFNFTFPEAYLYREYSENWIQIFQNQLNLFKQPWLLWKGPEQSNL